MSRLAVILLALVLLLAPIFAALPDDTTQTQTAWAALLSALVMWGVLAAAAHPRRAVYAGPAGPGDAAPASGSAGQSAVLAFAVLLGLTLMSALMRLATHHSIAYLDLMLRGWAALAAEGALFILCRRLARQSRHMLYLVVGAAVVGSAVISSIGVNEALLNVVAHQASARISATSTQDFLAGYLVLMVPVTVALFLGAPAEKRLPLLLGLITVLQMAALLASGSRFALVSLVVAFAVMAAALARAVRHGLALDAPLRRRVVGIAVVIVLAALAAAGPILYRLHNAASEQNSGAFRLWTWRGAARMAAANPVLGTGIGTWIDTYPPYALTGFTRLAHNSYLQMADECGIPALLALTTALGFVGVAGVRGLKHSPAVAPASEVPMPAPRTARRERRQTAALVAETTPTDWLSAVAPADDRLLLCALLGSLAAGVIQDLIDSDWYVFFIGVTFWAFAGLAVGVAERHDSPVPPLLSAPARRASAVAGVVLMLLFVSQGVAAWFGYQAQSADDPGAARDAYQMARLWNPLSARYPAELGARVEARVGSAATAAVLLRTATRLEPSGTNFRRLGTILDGEGRHDEAATAYQDGLRVDPNSLDLLLPLAKDSAPPQALSLYRRIAALEDSPVGRVRAIGDITEARFAIADAALGDAAAATGNTGETVHFYGRARLLLEAYIDEDGTENTDRQAQSGYHPDPTTDAQFRDLYAHVMTGLAAASPADARVALQERATANGLRFQAVTDAAQADTAVTPAEAVAGYERAATGIEDYVASETHGPGASEAGAQMRGLYQHVLDALDARTPAEGQAAVRAREQAGLQKFDGAFPTP